MSISKRAFVLALILHLLVGGVLLKLLSSTRFYSAPPGRIEIHNAYVLNQAVPQPPLLQNEHVQKAEVAKSGVLPLSIAKPALVSPNANAQVFEATTIAAAATKIITPTATQTNSQPVLPNIEPLAPKEIQQLLQLISIKIQQHLAYPRLAQTETEQGQSVLQFEVTPQGELQNVQVTQSSGVMVLDQAALSAVLASSPINFPSNFHINQSLKLRLPVRFSL